MVMARGIKGNQGHIDSYKTPSGEDRFRVRLSINGQRLSKVFPTVELAEDYRDTQIQARRKDPAKTQASLTHVPLANFVRLWMEDRADGAPFHLAQRTRSNYYRAFKRWVLPYGLAGYDYRRLNAEHLTLWRREVIERAGTENVRTCLKVISGAYNWGIQTPETLGVSINPVGAIKWPTKARSHDVYVVEHIVVERIRRHILDHEEGADERRRERDALLLSLMAQTGCRPGEARQIELGMVDFEGRAIHLPKRISKTGHARKLRLWRPLADDIGAWVGSQELRLHQTLCCRHDGSEMGQFGWDRWREKAFEPARNAVADQLGDERLGNARAYDLCRHSFAAQAINALWDLNSLSEAMGHHISTLSQHYSHQLQVAREEDKRKDPELAVLKARQAVGREMSVGPTP